MTKTDFRKTLDAYRAARGGPRIVDVPDMQYLMVDGHGDPNTQWDWTLMLTVPDCAWPAPTTRSTSAASGRWARQARTILRQPVTTEAA